MGTTMTLICDSLILVNTLRRSIKKTLIQGLMALPDNPTINRSSKNLGGLKKQHQLIIKAIARQKSVEGLSSLLGLICIEGIVPVPAGEFKGNEGYELNPAVTLQIRSMVQWTPETLVMLMRNLPVPQAETTRLRAVNTELVDAIEKTAADRAYVAGLGAGEWVAFLKPHEAFAIANARKES